MAGEARVQIKVFLAPEVVAFLDRRSAETGRSRSAVAAEYLEQIIFVEAVDSGVDLALPAIREVVRAEFARMFERMFSFMVRTYLEAGTTHRLMQYHMLNPGEKYSYEDVKRINNNQWNAAYNALRERMPEIEELMRLAGIVDRWTAEAAADATQP